MSKKISLQFVFQPTTEWASFQRQLKIIGGESQNGEKYI
jgi:hypothetical protein